MLLGVGEGVAVAKDSADLDVEVGLRSIQDQMLCEVGDEVHVSESHHLRFAQPRAMSRKVSDVWTVPLCATHHRQVHSSGNEETWWQEQKAEPRQVAEELWRQRCQPAAATDIYLQLKE